MTEPATEPVPSPLSPAHDDAAAALLRMRDAGGQIFSAVTDAQPIAPHHLLALRAVHLGARTLSAIADASNRHVSSASRLIDQLVGMDLLDRSADPDDRRQIVLVLTDAGVTAVRRFAAMDRALAARMLRGLDEQDARDLTRLMDRLAANAIALAAELDEDPTVLDDDSVS